MPFVPHSVKQTNDPSDNVAISKREVHSYLVVEAAINPDIKRSRLRIPFTKEQSRDLVYDFVAPFVVGFGIEVALKRLHRVMALQGKTKMFPQPVCNASVTKKHKAFSHDLDKVLADFESNFKSRLTELWHSRVVVNGEHSCGDDNDRIDCLSVWLRLVSAFMKDRYYLEGNFVDLWNEAQHDIPRAEVAPGDRVLLEILSELCAEIAVPYYEERVIHINGLDDKHRISSNVEDCESEDVFHHLNGSGDLCRKCRQLWLTGTELGRNMLNLTWKEYT